MHVDVAERIAQANRETPNQNGLVPLLLAEQGLTGAPPGRRPNPLNPFPCTKRLRPWLTDEQNQLLQSLPAVSASIDSAIDGYIALARAFLPRAWRLARQTDHSYPVEFERCHRAPLRIQRRCQPRTGTDRR